MSWLSTLLGRKQPKEELELIELRTTRLRQLLRCYGDFLDCVADAAEKQSGDFILDRQYAISLAERALDLADSILFDVEIIAARYFPELSGRIEALRASVHDTLSRPLESPVATSGEEAGEEPEYRLLREMRRMLFTLTLPPEAPDRAAGCVSLLDVVHVAQGEASSAVAALLAGAGSATLAAHVVDNQPGLRLLVAALGGALKSGGTAQARLRIDEIGSWPLAAFLAGVAGLPDETSFVVRTAATREHAYLTSVSSTGELVVDALLGADDRINHLFARHRSAGGVEGCQPVAAGLSGTRAEGVTTIWRRGLPQERMGEALGALGRLAAAAGQAASPTITAGGTQSIACGSGV